MWTGLWRSFMHVCTLCDTNTFLDWITSHMTFVSFRHSNTSVAIYWSRWRLQDLSVRNTHVRALKQTDLVFFSIADRKLLLSVCLCVCDGSVRQGVCLQCNHRGLISVWAQVLATWGAIRPTDPPPERSRYENCPLQMLFLPLSLWYILCWLFQLTSCHL